MSHFRLHHLGYLVDDLTAAAEHWRSVCGARLDGEIIHDAGQQARVLLMREPAAAHWIELISPDSPESHLNRALQRQVRLHHVAYSVDDFPAAMAHLRAQGCLPLSKPAQGAAFQREIMWFQDPRRGLIEIIAPGAGPYALS